MVFKKKKANTMQGNIKQVRRNRRKMGIRKKLLGTTERPRLSVYRSLAHIYAQIIDDISGKTLVSSDSVQVKLKGGNKSAAVSVGKDLATKAKKAGITAVAFDRNGFKFHGRIKALADAAREGGLQF
jgi:large subunit ribosomal protein L18